MHVHKHYKDSKIADTAPVTLVSSSSLNLIHFEIASYNIYKLQEKPERKRREIEFIKHIRTIQF